jgi:hypothetical protein
VSVVHVVSRRQLLWSAAAAATLKSGHAAGINRQTHRFVTSDFDINIAIEFYDRYSSRGFWFREHLRERPFCLSAAGQQDHNCLANFQGSLAIAKYKLVPRSKLQHAPAMREHVCTLDYDKRLDWRPPFDRSITLLHGEASDVQAFGFEDPAGFAARVRAPQVENLWYLFRQDLYLGTSAAPFAIAYWKHALNAIRILDIIPGDDTWVAKQ